MTQEYEMKLVLISGASGFLGHALSTKLLSDGVAVRALVRSSQKGELLRRLGAEIVIGDVRDSSIRAATAHVDTVIHCAAAIGPPQLPREVFRSINVDGTRNLVEALKDSSYLQRYVQVSTVAVLGETNPQDPAREETLCQPIDAYGETKLQAEKIVLDATNMGFPAVIARPMWIYGSKSAVTANLFRRIALRKLPMVGPATNTMQPIAIEDAVAGIMKCAVVGGAVGRVYNIAGPEILTVRSMCEVIANAMGATLPKLHVPLSTAVLLARVSESLFPFLGIAPPLTLKKLEFFRINNSYSIERARQELDWIPQITFREGAGKVAEELKFRSPIVSVA
jgi:nucleoside-diphosphate-sugar epimerase